MDIPRKSTKTVRRVAWLAVLAIVVIAVSVALAQLEPAVPTVDRSVVYTDIVRRGDMIRRVRGPGTLQPERILFVSALSAGRVDALPIRPGAVVEPDTVVLEISNRDVMLAALEAEGQLTGAQAQLANLSATLESQVLGQQAAVGQVRADAQDARRRHEADEELFRSGLIPRIDLERSRDRAAELRSRLEIEEQRLDSLRDAVQAQLEAERTQVERHRAIAAFERREVESLKIRAGASGVLQELPLEVGQWITPGTTLAKVADPSRLKAVLRVPETQAKDVLLGQKTVVDTRNGEVSGRVMRIDPAVQNGAVIVEIALEGELPTGARPDLSVEGIIEIEHLENVLYVGRPAFGQPDSVVGLFRIEDGLATRVSVRLGRSSVRTIEIVEGLQEGDEVILSDMSSSDGFDRIRLD